MMMRLSASLLSGFLVAALVSLSRPAIGQSPSAAESSTKHYKKDYRFTADWFTHAIPVWRKVLKPYKGKPDIRYLEIGVFQGRSALWALENILTHPTARMTTIDILINDAYEENIEKSGFADKITTVVGRSQDIMKTLEPESFDIIYVDGSHRGDDVLVDAVLAWALLDWGGTLIFDDYLWYEEWPKELVPTAAIDTFVTLFRHKLDVVLRGDQLVLRKRKSPCLAGGESYCSRLGRYAYQWKKKALFDPVRGKEIELTDGERAIVEGLIKGIEIGQTTVTISPELRRNPAFVTLDAKLK